MKQDFQIVMKSRAMVLILAASATIRLILYFFFLPRTASNFGPDEGTYASLAKFVSTGMSVQNFPDFGANLYNSSKSFILPSAFFIKLGVNELDAVRLMSTIYGHAALFIFSLSYVACRRIHNVEGRKAFVFFDKKSIFLISIFAFLPSNFAWSILGLREAGSQFWLIASFYFLLKLHFSLGYRPWIYSTFFVTSLTLAYGVRPETALLFSLVAFLYSVYSFIKTRRFTLVLLLLLGMYLGLGFTTTPDAVSTTPDAVSTTPDAVSTTPDANQDRATQLTDPLLTIKSIEKYVSKLSALEAKRNVSTLDAESALPKSYCINSRTEISVILICNLAELPYRLLSFLFRPLLFYDTGSIALTLAAVENVMWSLLIAFSLLFALRTKSNDWARTLKYGFATYIIVYSSLAALHEGNLGTAFRHKSSILWPLILFLMISVYPNLERKNKIIFPKD